MFSTNIVSDVDCFKMEDKLYRVSILDLQANYGNNNVYINFVIPLSTIHLKFQCAR